MNFVAGAVGSGRDGAVLFWGWIVALRSPVAWIWYAPNWNGRRGGPCCWASNSGLCWSMTQTAKLDITKAEETGASHMGLNEFSGYVGGRSRAS